MKPHYNFIFHFSELRTPEKAWAYICKDDQYIYWNNSKKTFGKITYGSNPDECVIKAVNKKYHDPVAGTYTYTKKTIPTCKKPYHL